VCLAVGANKRSEVTMGTAGEYKGRLPKRWLFATALGIALSLALSLYGFYRTRNLVPAFNPEAQLEVVYNKVFMNETVEMDGKQFNHCRFVNVKYEYRGLKPFWLEHCVFSGDRVIGLGNNEALTCLVALQKGLGAPDMHFVDPILEENVQSPRLR